MLTTLGTQHALALEVFLQEFEPVPDELHGYFCDRSWPIERCVGMLAANARGEQLGEGWVPCSTWFWAHDGVLQGVINVRHHLSPALREFGGHIGYSVAPSHRRRGIATAMLAAVLGPCRSLGIKRALLTCDALNIGSWRAIEACGGRLEKEEASGPERALQRWYWIDLQ